MKNIWQSIKRLFVCSAEKPPIKTDGGFGMIEEAPRQEDYFLGGIRQSLKVILSLERDYTPWLPVNEDQQRGFDSFSCVVFSGLNNLEIIYKKIFGVEVNWSDRFLAAMTPVVPNRGTTYAKFWDAVRKYGLVLEEDYPWGGHSGREYVKKPPQEIIDKGQKVFESFEIQHEWVDTSGCDPNRLYDALLYGPLQVSVNASATYSGRRDKRTDHSVSIYTAEKGKSFSILDHYTRKTYTVPWNFYFGSAKQASIIKKKLIPLIQVFGKPEIYAIYGNEARHISNEYSWKYGAKIGKWKYGEKNLIPLNKKTFDSKFTIGKQINFNHI